MARPSYKSGFATHSNSAHSWAWRQCVAAWCPSLGGTGRNLRDHSGFRRSITLQQDTSSGPHGLLFDGVDDYGDTVDDSVPSGSPGVYSFASNEPYTVALWYKGTDTTVPAFGIGTGLLGRNVTDIYANCSLDAGYFKIFHYSGGWLNLSSTTLVADDVQRSLVFVNLLNNTGTIYVDGVAEATGDTTIKSAVVGDRRYVISSLMRGWPNAYTAGAIDDIRVYRRSWTANEVQAFHALGPAGAYTPARRKRARVAAAAAAANYRTLLGVGT